MRRESRGIIYRKDDSRKKEQSLIIHQFHAVHISNREVHKTVPSFLSERYVCTMYLTGMAKGETLDSVVDRCWTVEEPPCTITAVQSMNLKGNSAAHFYFYFF